MLTWALSRRFGFVAEQPGDYSDGPAFDLRQHLNGPITYDIRLGRGIGPDGLAGWDWKFGLGAQYGLENDGRIAGSIELGGGADRPVDHSAAGVFVEFNF